MPLSYQLLVPDADKADMELANILGWSVEIMQAFYLVADDIMDGSITRRGQPCWYRRSDVGLAAFNDSIILESLVFNIIKKYFRAKPYYLSLLENLLEVSKVKKKKEKIQPTNNQFYVLIESFFFQVYDVRTEPGHFISRELHQSEREGGESGQF